MEELIETGPTTRKRKLAPRSDKRDDSLVKDEVLSDDGGHFMSNNSDSDDDHIPLANVTLSGNEDIIYIPQNTVEN